MRSAHWPLFDIEIRTPRLTLRCPDDEMLEEIVDHVVAGLHDPSWMPFGVAWTDAEPPELEWNALRFHWRVRAEARPESFRIPFAVLVDGRVVGQTDIAADDFATMREFETGSWLARDFQGHGIGKEMRLAMLTLGFAGLGADVATTSAWHDNGPSLGVTRRLGYTETGRRRMRRRDEPDELLMFEMRRAHFETIRRDDITLHGLDRALEFLAVSPRT